MFSQPTPPIRMGSLSDSMAFVGTRFLSVEPPPPAPGAAFAKQHLRLPLLTPPPRVPLSPSPPNPLRRLPSGQLRHIAPTTVRDPVVALDSGGGGREV